MSFARWLFRGAGIYGLLVLTPQYFLEDRLGRDSPPPITHPEYFYGFVGTALAWQIVYLVIGQDPARYRVFMLLGVVAKSSFGVAAIVLFAGGRIPALVLVFGLIDLALGVLFAVAFLKTKPATAPR